MSAHRRQGRKATRSAARARVHRAGHRTGNGAATPAEQSGPDAVETAALEYARALPGLLRKAMNRQARGKPSPLLRSAPRLIREAMQLLDMHEERKERKPKENPQLGVLTAYELQLCRNLLAMQREIREPVPAPPAEAPARLEREEAPPQLAAPEPRPLYNGPDRRLKQIPAHVFLGRHERRQRQQRATVQLVAGQRVLYIGEPPSS